jgi:hypothetical protein
MRVEAKACVVMNHDVQGWTRPEFSGHCEIEVLKIRVSNEQLGGILKIVDIFTVYSYFLKIRREPYRFHVTQPSISIREISENADNLSAEQVREFTLLF